MPYITRIYSKVNDFDIITHVVVSKNQVQGSFHFSCEELDSFDRVDLVDKSQFLQVAMLSMAKGKSFIPHYHPMRPVFYEECRTQELWLVMNGSVKMYLFEEDSSYMGEVVLHAGDFALTLTGGHNYLALTEDTSVIEIKSGPYDYQRDKIRFEHLVSFDTLEE